VVANMYGALNLRRFAGAALENQNGPRANPCPSSGSGNERCGSLATPSGVGLGRVALQKRPTIRGCPVAGGHCPDWGRSIVGPGAEVAIAEDPGSDFSENDPGRGFLMLGAYPSVANTRLQTSLPGSDQLPKSAAALFRG